jgi:hypothetical protein
MESLSSHTRLTLRTPYMGAVSSTEPGGLEWNPDPLVPLLYVSVGNISGLEWCFTRDTMEIP